MHVLLFKKSLNETHRLAKLVTVLHEWIEIHIIKYLSCFWVNDFKLRFNDSKIYNSNFNAHCLESLGYRYSALTKVTVSKLLIYQNIFYQRHILPFWTPCLCKTPTMNTLRNHTHMIIPWTMALNIKHHCRCTKPQTLYHLFKTLLPCLLKNKDNTKG